MTVLINDPVDFAAESLDGFLDAYQGFVQAAPGGVVRATRHQSNKVALVIGGGAGHYPAFSGFVGHGLADGAVIGDVFASPSAARIARLSTTVETGAGVLLAFGNYAGDALNFGLAAEEMRSHGIDTRLVAVTDDVASAGVDQLHRRRGIAGGFIVFKITGAAAEMGSDLDEVERVARLANDRTRTFGVAFSGCTLPGSAEPLFQVTEGRMSLGLGVHGEPGIGDQELTSADGVARLLVDRLLRERPHEGKRAAVLLNGLGSTKYEELFVVWRSVSRYLRAEGVDLVEPEVTELVTSLDMGGCSLSVCWLDDELLPYWKADAHTPAFRRVQALQGVPWNPTSEEKSREPALAAVTPKSRTAARQVLCALRVMAEELHQAEEMLGMLDAVAGDGDHGRGMTRGCDAAVSAAQEAAIRGEGGSGTLAAASAAWADNAGGTSGALWGAALLAIARCMDDDSILSPVGLARGVSSAVDRVQELGGARLGDKTMVDAMIPFTEELSAQAHAGADLKRAWTAAVEKALVAANGTATMLPRLGRARPLGQKSLGNNDPGAVSFALCVRAVGLAIPTPSPEPRGATR